MIEQKGMTFDQDFAYSFPLFSSFLKKREEEKENELAKIVIKDHAFLLDWPSTGLKGMSFDHDFCSFILLFFISIFLRGKRKG